MRAAHEGDAAAYRRLLEEIGPVMQRYLERRFGRHDFIEDCVQECLLSIHRARESYDPRRGFRAWMFAIVRHKAIDLLRRRGTRERHETRADEAVEQARAAIPEPTVALEAGRLLTALDPKQREAVVLTKLEGRSFAEAASRLGVSPGAVKTRVHRGLRRMRALLAEEDR